MRSALDRFSPLTFIAFAALVCAFVATSESVPRAVASEASAKNLMDETSLATARGTDSSAKTKKNLMDGPPLAAARGAGSSAQEKKSQTDRKNPSKAESQSTDQQEIPLKIDTDLVTVPVVATHRPAVP